MPIRPEERSRYPKDWPAISLGTRQGRAGNCCEWCGVRNGALGGRTPDGTFLPALPLGERALGLEWPRPGERAWCQAYGGGRRERLRVIRIVLTVAHLDHVPENCAPDNLAALCQRCHLAYDAEHHRQTRRARMAVGDLFIAAAGSRRANAGVPSHADALQSEPDCIRQDQCPPASSHSLVSNDVVTPTRMERRDAQTHVREGRHFD